MKKHIFFLLLSLLSYQSNATIYTISVNGLDYIPSTVNASVGDTISFIIGPDHPTQQVSQSTWNANGTSGLPGGFGLHESNFQFVLTADMMPTVWYVCTFHVTLGMKGRINVAAIEDIDDDGVADGVDNCPNTANPDQSDVDNDGIGDVCDEDIDGDEIPNIEDNCPMNNNPLQEDMDEDGIGDNCDDDDMDGDGVLNEEDNCPETFNVDQTDNDQDGIGDLCDDDLDNDGILNGQDNCPLLSNPNQEDTDEDGIGDVCDDDIDGDGVANADDNCFEVANPSQEDLDNDGIGDVCDSDIDGDGVANDTDAFPMDATETVDTDNDGIGNNTDLDDDNDGCTDEEEITFGTNPLIDDCNVSVNELDSFGDIEIFPVPANDILFVNTNISIESILIYDLSGKIVKEAVPQVSEVSIDVSDIDTGEYFVKILNTRGSYFLKRITILR